MNRDDANAFLACIHGGAGPLHFQTFDDSPAKRPELAHACYATPAAAAVRLQRQQERGAGLFVAVCKMRGSKRGTAEFESSRCVWADDDKPRETPRQDWPLQPHLIVESSPGKFHYYWRTETCTDAARLVGILKTMASAYGTDPSVADVARVMRIAGTWNLKGASFQTRIVTHRADAAPYPLAHIEAAFGVSLVAQRQATNDRASLDLRGAVATILSGDAGVHDAILRVSASWAHFGVPQEHAQEMLQALLEQGQKASPGPRMAGHLADLPRIVEGAYTKFAAAAFTEVADPLDLFGTRPTTQAVFNPADYPDAIARLAADIGRRIGCDPVMVAWIALVVCAAMLSDSVKLRVKARDTAWLEPARIWVAFIAPPSAKKSPALTAVLAYARQLQARYSAEHDEEMRRHAGAVADAKRQGLPLPAAPVLRRLIASDATTEALVAIFEHNTEGVLLVKDELSGFFGGMDAYRANGAAKDRAFYLEAYNGGPMVIDRVSSGARSVQNVSLCIVGGIQPEPMRRIASKLEEDGLLQRFITVHAADSTEGEDVAPDADVWKDWHGVLESLAESRDYFTPWPDVVTLDPEAQALLDAARARIHRLAKAPGIDKRFAFALGKGEGQLARITLIFHAIENGPVPVIPAATVAKAVRVFEGFVTPSAAEFYASIVGVSETHEHARWIAGHILAHEMQTIRAWHIYRANPALRGDDGARLIADAMAHLELAGWVTPRAARRRDSLEWDVNARVHVLYAATAAAERTSRAQVVADIKRQVS